MVHQHPMFCRADPVQFTVHNLLFRHEIHSPR